MNDDIDDTYDGNLLNITAPIPYEERMKQQTAEQVGMSRDAVREHLANKVDEAGHKVYEAVFDPENLPEVKHNWVDRGLKMSCEGAGHPNHQSWKQGARR